MLTKKERPLRVTVVITACSDDRGLRESLAKVTRQAKSMGASTLLIFNTWPDDLPRPARVELEKQVDLLLFEPRPGKSVALNTAVQAVASDIFAFTDDDALPSEKWLSRLLEPFYADRDLAGVGGPVEPVFPETPLPSWYRRLVRHKGTSFLGPKHYLGESYRMYDLPVGGSISPVPLGSNCAWRHEWLERFPFREDLGPNRTTGLRGGEDTCFALEVMEAGGRVAYVPRALVHHPVEESRTKLDYVREGFAYQGKEYARILKILSRECEDLDLFQRRVEREGGFSDTIAWLGPPRRQIKRQLSRSFAREVCAEFQSS